MKLKRFSVKIGFCISLLSIIPFANSTAQKLQSDNGDGTYTNPVIASDFPDPDVILVDASVRNTVLV